MVSILSPLFCYKTKLLRHSDITGISDLSSIEMKSKFQSWHYSLNNHPKELIPLMDKLFHVQNKIFNYSLFPESLQNEIIQGVSTNLKEAGKTTIFDCLFTDH